MKFSSATHFTLAKKLSEAAEKASPEARELLLLRANQHLALAAVAEKYDVSTTLHSYETGVNRDDLEKD